MTAKDDDDRYEFEDDENEESRSIFSATWFRVVLATVGVAVIAAVALPYMLGGSTPTPEKLAGAPPPLLDTKPAASLATSPGPEPSGPLVSATPPPPSTPAVTGSPAATEPSRAVPGAAVAPPAPERATVAEAPKPAAEVKPAPRPRTEMARPVQAKQPAPKPAAQVRHAASKPSSAKSAPAARKGYWVQVGTFKDPAAAHRLAAKLRDQKHAGSSRPVTVADSSDRLSRVQVGPFADRASASTTVRSLQAQGFKPFVVARGA